MVNPAKQVPVLDYGMRYPPLGLLSVASFVETQVEVLDLKAHSITDQGLLQKFSKADFVGFTTLTPSIDSVLELCQKAKKQGARTVLGGVHPTLVPDVVLHPAVDYVVRGEGEVTFAELVSGDDPSSIEGLTYKKDGKAVHNQDRPEIPNLDDLPPLRRDLLDFGKYAAWGMKLDAISTSRGCRFKCIFCCVPCMWKRYRCKSPERVVEEVRRISKDTRIVAIVDDDFCHDMERVGSICDLLVQERLDHFHYSCFARIDEVVKYPHVVEKMAEAGIRTVFIGIEAGSQRSLDEMKKRTDLSLADEAIRILNRNGIAIWASHIIGNLSDTKQDVLDMIEQSIRRPIDTAQYTIVTPNPGTELYKIAEEKGLIDDCNFADYCECEPHMHTEHLSRLDLMELIVLAYYRFNNGLATLKRFFRWAFSRRKRWLLRLTLKGWGEQAKYHQRNAQYFFTELYEQFVQSGEKQLSREFRRLVLRSFFRQYSFLNGLIAGISALVGVALIAGILRLVGAGADTIGNAVVLPVGALVVSFLSTSAFARKADADSRKSFPTEASARWSRSTKMEPCDRPRFLRNLIVSVACAAGAVLAILLPRSAAPLRTFPAILVCSLIAFLSAFFASYWELSTAKLFQKG